MSDRPVARQFTRQKTVTLRRPATHYDELHPVDGILLAEGTRLELNEVEVIRSGYCSDCGTHSDNFIGPNEHGWIFLCAGLPKKPGQPPQGSHYFLNSAPANA